MFNSKLSIKEYHEKRLYLLIETPSRSSGVLHLNDDDEEIKQS